MKESVKNLHVVAFDVPYPANYGGVIDIFYKLKALQQSGVRIHLHCYSYGRSESPALNKLCASVTYYKRKVFKNPIYNKKPYIVATRNSNALIEDLLKDDYPILFEGLHCTYFLDDPRLANRYKIVRTHNVEHDYYSQLEKVENNLFKKYFFKVESERLRKYEKVLKHANLIAAISPNDELHFAKKFKNVVYLPPFHGNEEVLAKSGRGSFVLYHGNLAVGENDKAALYLIEKVFSKIDLPCIIAGNDPSKELEEMTQRYEHVVLKQHLSAEEIHKMIHEAQINVMYTKQDTGIKLKLVNALFMGRHCIANDKMVNNTGMESLCIRANKAAEIVDKIKSYWNVHYSADESAHRKEILLDRFSNQSGAKSLAARIFEQEVVA
jgi:hypothetical protein